MTFNVFDYQRLYAGAGLVAGANASALGPTVSNDTYNIRREKNIERCKNTVVPVR